MGSQESDMTERLNHPHHHGNGASHSRLVHGLPHLHNPGWIRGLNKVIPEWPWDPLPSSSYCWGLQVSPPHLSMTLEHGDWFLFIPNPVTHLEQIILLFQVPDNLISIHPRPRTLLEHDRLPSLNWFTLSIFLIKWCKPFSCQQLCFLCPFNFCLNHLENPNSDSIQLFLTECMCVCIHVHTHNWDISATSQIFKGLSIFRLTSISLFLVLLGKDNALTYPYNRIHLPFLKNLGSLISTPSPLTFPLAYKCIFSIWKHLHTAFFVFFF